MIRKILVAGGAALLPLYANAQSQVTIYGLVDGGVEVVNHLTPASGTSYRLVSGGQGGSRFGFRGKEDLGNGLSAVFALEGGINLDEGSSGQGGRLFGRDAYVGLQTPYGRVTLGRQTTVLWQFDVDFDPIAPARYSGPSIDAAYVGRIDNSVKYFGTRGPITISALYSTGAEVPGDSRVGRLYGAGAVYKLANFKIGLSYENQAGTTVETRDNTTKRTALGVAYKFKPVEVFAAYTYRKNDVAPESASIDQYWIGAKMRLASDLSLVTVLFGANNRDSDDHPKMLSALLTKNLSKRTSMYLLAGYAKNESTSNLGVAGFGTVVAGENQTGLVAGLAHRF